MIVLPATIVVLHPFIQETGDVGTVDMATRIPLEVASGLMGKLSDEEKRRLYRIDGVGVSFVARGRDYFGAYNDGRSVGASCRASNRFGVAVETERK
jgi:hypothetical protein